MFLPVERVRGTWENIESSLWFIPTIFAGFAIALSLLLPELDEVTADNIGTHREWIFSGTADAARTILSVIAGSLITVISLLFSITVLTLQQATTQFSPRVIRSFTSDRGSQVVLGIYIATFLYSLLILRQIRNEASILGQFVPLISVTVAIVFAIICLGALVYFVHHIATLLQASTVIESIHKEMLNAIDNLYPEAIGNPSSDRAEQTNLDMDAFRMLHRGDTVTIAASKAGFLRSVDDAAISAALPDGTWAIVHAPVGKYIIRGMPLIEVGGRHLEDGQRNALEGAFFMDRQRSLSQDALFDIRQLVDIALKALSPSIHDPTTAQHAISALGDSLACLAGRTFPPSVRSIESDGEHYDLWVNRPDFADFVAESFDQIRRTATGNVAVTLHLLDTFDAIARHASGSDDRIRPLVEQVDAIAENIGEILSNDRDMDEVQQRIAGVRAHLADYRIRR